MPIIVHLVMVHCFVIFVEETTGLLSELNLTHLTISNGTSYEILCRSAKSYYESIASSNLIDKRAGTFFQFELKSNLAGA